MKTNRDDVIRTAADCRSQITRMGAPCRVCGRRYSVMHFPAEQRGAFCPEHCGCSIGGIVDHDAVAGALVLVDD